VLAVDPKNKGSKLDRSVYLIKRLVRFDTTSLRFGLIGQIVKIRILSDAN
jgi:hypothetical protein